MRTKVSQARAQARVVTKGKRPSRRILRLGVSCFVD